jgi:hypothetical protein
VPRQLPSFVLDILPAIYAGYDRVLLRSGLSTGQLYGLFLLRSSKFEIDGKKAWPLSEFLESLTRGMRYTAPAAASNVLAELTDRGLARQEGLDAERRDLSPGRPRRAVLLQRAGEEKFQNFSQMLLHASSDFLEKLPDSVAQDLEQLIVAATKYQSILPALIEAFSRPARRQTTSPEAPSELGDLQSEMPLDEPETNASEHEGPVDASRRTRQPIVPPTEPESAAPEQPELPLKTDDLDLSATKTAAERKGPVEVSLPASQPPKQPPQREGPELQKDKEEPA